MSEVPAVDPKVAKTYLCKMPSFSFAWSNDAGKKETIIFVNGRFSTDDADKQAHIEGSEFFGRSIEIESENVVARAKLVAISDSATAKANASEKTALAAEYSAALPARLRAAAEADKKAAAEAVANLADFDKANAPKTA